MSTIEPRGKSSKIERFFANCFLATIVLIFTFGLAEFVCRQFLEPDSIFKNVAQVRDLRAPKPYVTFGGVPFSGSLNRLGYPGPAPAPEKPADEVRIVVLGGSTVMLGPPTLTDLIQTELSNRGIKTAKVYNFGTAGSNSTQDYARLIFEVADVKPDIVVFYNGGNDILSRGPDNRVGYPYNYLLWEANPLIEPSLETYPTFTLLLFGSSLFRTLLPNYFIEAFVKQAYRNGVKALAEDDPKFSQILAHHYVNVSSKSAAFSKMIGAKPLVLFQPILHFKENKTGWEARNSISSVRFLNHIKDFQKITTIALAQDAKKYEYRASDLSTAFDNHDNSYPVYTDFIHLTELGKKHMARVVTNQIVLAFPDIFSSKAKPK